MIEADRCALNHEEVIEWVDGLRPEYFDYVRELVIWSPRRRQRPGAGRIPGRLVAFAVLAEDAPAFAGSGMFLRRAWWVADHDPYVGTPCEAVDPQSLRPGQVSAPGRFALGQTPKPPPPETTPASPRLTWTGRTSRARVRALIASSPELVQAQLEVLALTRQWGPDRGRLERVPLAWRLATRLAPARQAGWVPPSARRSGNLVCVWCGRRFGRRSSLGSRDFCDVDCADTWTWATNALVAAAVELRDRRGR